MGVYHVSNHHTTTATKTMGQGPGYPHAGNLRRYVGFAGTWIKLVDFHPIVINSAQGIFAVLSILVYFAIKKSKFPSRRKPSSAE